MPATETFRYIGRENHAWFLEKYIELSDKVPSIAMLSRKLIEACRVLSIEGSEEVKRAIAEELRRAGRPDLAKIMEKILA